MIKVNFKSQSSAVNFFKVFNTEVEANEFIKQIGDLYISSKIIWRGCSGFDRASNNPTATSEATDLISANQVNANDDVYDIRLAA